MVGQTTRPGMLFCGLRMTRVCVTLQSSAETIKNSSLFCMIVGQQKRLMVLSGTTQRSMVWQSTERWKISDLSITNLVQHSPSIRYIMSQKLSASIYRQLFTDSQWDAISSALKDYADYGDEEATIADEIDAKISTIFRLTEWCLLVGAVRYTLPPHQFVLLTRELFSGQ